MDVNGYREYIEAYDAILSTEDLEHLRTMAIYLLVGRAINDRGLTQSEQTALAEYALSDMGLEEKGTVH